MLAHAAPDSHDEARALVDQSQAQMKIDPERSRQLAEQALQLLGGSPEADLQVRAHLLLCDYQSERNREAAQRHVTQARTLLSKVQRTGLESGLLSCEGELNENAGDNAKASGLYEQAVLVAEQTHDDEMLADALHKRGHLRGIRGELASGLTDLKRARAIYERIQLPLNVLTSENTIAILYNRMGDFAQARHYYQNTLKAQTAAGLVREQAVTQYNLGRSLENLKEWDAAKHAFESVLKLSRDLGYTRGTAYALRGLASVQNARNQPAEALTLLDQAARLQQAVPDARLQAQMQLQRGISLRLLHRPAESVAVLNEALAVFGQADSRAEQAMTHGELSASLADLGDLRNALEHQKLFKQVSDELMASQLDERFASLKVDYDRLAQDREIALSQQAQAAAERALKQERLASRWLTLAIVLALALVGVFAALLWRHRRTSSAMRSLAMTDELTGLPNRRAALAELEAQLARAPPRCALLLADIDLFKAINDAHGHLVGDQILRGVGDVVRSLGGTCLARFGGEEFVAVLPEASLEVAMATAEQLRLGVAAIDVSRWTPGRSVTISVGVTLIQPNDTMSTLLRRADEALYAAKNAGRNCVMSQVPVTGAQAELVAGVHSNPGLVPAP